MRFQFDPRFERGLRRDIALRRHLRVRAEAAAEAAERYAAQAHAPWMPRRGNRGTVIVENTLTGFRVVNTDHAGHLQEWGSARNSPHAPLRRGVRAAGLRLKQDTE